MGSILLHTADESITLTARAAEALLSAGNGDAALLYIVLLRRHGTVQPRALAGELRWDKPRIEAAEQALRLMGLLAPTGEDIPEPADEKPVYQQSDIIEHLESSGEFRSLTAEVEKKLGKRLTTPDMAILLELDNHLGLPPDVIYLLVCHCVERMARKYGEGRRPTLKQIEKEGYNWARRGIDTLTEASAYLKTYNERLGAMPAYMRALQLGDRTPVPSEEKYLAAWLEWGFPAETVAMAYDRTVLKLHEFKWPYCNGILKKWHESGVHTPEEIERKDRPAPKQQPQSGKPQSADEEMLKYVQELHRNRG